MAVCLAVSLHGFKVRIFHEGYLPILVYLHAYGFRFDIFVQRIKVVYALAELGRLLVIEHGENGTVAHAFPDSFISRREFVRELLTEVLPKYAVVAGIGIYRLVIR